MNIKYSKIPHKNSSFANYYENCSFHSYLTPLMACKSLVRLSMLIELGTASSMIPMEFFIIEHVVIITIIENAKVHSGSAIFA